MEVYLHSFSERLTLTDNLFQCAFTFFLVVCFNRIVEDGYKAIKVCL